MNIESYIVAFIKKNDYCNLPGIGNFQIRKNANGEKEVLFSNQSIIDDYFASFIGVNENVSINKATNAISEYAKKIKTEIMNGNTVPIPGLGKLSLENGKIVFTTENEDSFLKPADAKNFKEIKFGNYVKLGESHDGDEEKYESDHNEEPSKPQMVTFETEKYNPAYDNDSMVEKEVRNKKNKHLAKNILTVVAILGVVALLTWAFYKFILSNQNTNDAVVTAPNHQTTQPLQQSTTAPLDSNNSALPHDSLTDSTGHMPPGASINVVVNEYDSQISADLRAQKLKSYGWTVGQKDANASQHLVYVTVLVHNGNASATKDSVKGVLNPSGNVYVLQ